jgi:5'-deoxynucleotidase YfbR-like HD superfamily hydrolase
MGDSHIMKALYHDLSEYIHLNFNDDIIYLVKHDIRTAAHIKLIASLIKEVAPELDVRLV